VPFPKPFGRKTGAAGNATDFLETIKEKRNHCSTLNSPPKPVELSVKILGATICNGEKREVSTREILTEHLIEDLGRVVAVKDWARSLLSGSNDAFYKSLAKKREQIETGAVRGERELLSDKCRSVWASICPRLRTGFTRSRLRLRRAQRSCRSVNTSTRKMVSA
jgi:hypothetical protein